MMSSATRVLIVDADDAGAAALRQLLAAAGFESSHAASVDRAVDHLARGAADVVLLALGAPGLRDVARLVAAAGEAQVVLLAAQGQESLAHEGLRLGACDAVENTRDVNALLFALERAANDGRLRRELAALRARVSDEARQALVGRSGSMARVRELVGRAAATRMTVLVTGEQGAGKDTVARLVHELSDRAGRPFVVVRCAGAAGAALEGELFGGVRGGLLESARGGTLVLDEVDALPASVRVRLAQMLAERVVRRLGTEELVPVDVRVVLTVRMGADDVMPADEALLGERNMLPIAVPPLRERRSDIPLLVQHFRSRIAREVGVELPALSAETMTSLLGHQWPGNVRELEHWMERLAYAASSEGTTPAGSAIGPGSDFAQLDAARLTLEELERKYILHVLDREQGHQSRAAERLGIDRRTLYRKLKEYRDDGVASVRRAG